MRFHPGQIVRMVAEAVGRGLVHLRQYAGVGIGNQGARRRRRPDVGNDSAEFGPRQRKPRIEKTNRIRLGQTDQARFRRAEVTPGGAWRQADHSSVTVGECE